MYYKIAIWIALCVASAILYRLGGASGYNTKFRDFGVPACVSAVVVLLGQAHWSVVASAILMFGAMTQYWKGRRVD